MLQGPGDYKSMKDKDSFSKQFILNTDDPQGSGDHEGYLVTNRRCKYALDTGDHPGPGDHKGLKDKDSFSKYFILNTDDPQGSGDHEGVSRW